MKPNVYQELLEVLKDGLQPEDAQQVIALLSRRVVTSHNVEWFVDRTLEILLSQRQDALEVQRILQVIEGFVARQQKLLAARMREDEG